MQHAVAWSDGGKGWGVMDRFELPIVLESSCKSGYRAFWAIVVLSLPLGAVLAAVFGMEEFGFLGSMLLFSFGCWLLLIVLDFSLGTWINGKLQASRFRKGLSGELVDVEVRFDGDALTIVYLSGERTNRRHVLGPKDLGGLRYLSDFKGGGIEIEYRPPADDSFKTERWSLIQVDEATKSQFLERLDRYALEHLSTSIYDGARPEPVDGSESGEGAVFSDASSNVAEPANASPFEEPSRDRFRSARSRTSRRGARQRSSRRDARSHTSQKRDPIALAFDLEELEVKPRQRRRMQRKQLRKDLKWVLLFVFCALWVGMLLAFSINDTATYGYGWVIGCAMALVFLLAVAIMFFKDAFKQYERGAGLPWVLVGQDKLVYFKGEYWNDYDFQVYNDFVNGIKCISRISGYEVRDGLRAKSRVIVVRGLFTDEVEDLSDDSGGSFLDIERVTEFPIKRVYTEEDERKLLACLDRLKQA